MGRRREREKRRKGGGEKEVRRGEGGKGEEVRGEEGARVNLVNIFIFMY